MTDDRHTEMARLYVEDGLSYAEIGEQFGISRQRVGQILGPLSLVGSRSSRRRAAHEIALRAAHARFVNGQTTREQEVATLGYKTWDGLYRAFRTLGLKIERVYSEPAHGTDARYRSRKFGCRCDDCRRAHSDAQKKLRGRQPPKHGTVSAYRNYGCDCKRCLGAAKADRRRKKRLRKGAKSA